jgi:16S rRNA U516 pseudouridylate synthase RsuA-like enzyme
MFAELGYNVRRLQRTRLGTLPLGTLKPGEWRFLLPREVAQLVRAEPKAPVVLKKPAKAE